MLAGRFRKYCKSPLVEINKVENAASKQAPRDWVNQRNLGMNQATVERTSVKLAAAIKKAKAIDNAHEDFSAGPKVFPYPNISLGSFI
jgi:hypothetical protein